MDADGGCLGFLVVGVGALGARRAAAVKAARGCRLVAVADRDRARARAVAKGLGVAAAADMEEGLDLDGVGAVAVATPHADHAGQVRRALEAGKHVVCEKPLAIGPVAARSLATQAEATGVRLTTGFNHRFFPPVADALRLVADGRIGRVESVRAQIGHRASAAFLDSWHTDPKRSGGGTLMDNGPHAFDLVRRLLGEVVAAQGILRFAPGRSHPCEVEAFALFRDADQGIAEVRSSWALEAGYLTLEVRGSGGHLRVETAPWRLAGRLSDGKRLAWGYLRERAAERLFRLRHGCERSLVAELEAVARSGPHPRPEASGWDGCRATEMVQAVYQSAQSGREVALRPLPVRLPGTRRDPLRRQAS